MPDHHSAVCAVGGDPAVLVEESPWYGPCGRFSGGPAGGLYGSYPGLDVVEVDVDTRLVPLCVLVAPGWERLERWPVQILGTSCGGCLRSFLNGRSFGVATAAAGWTPPNTFASWISLVRRCVTSNRRALRRSANAFSPPPRVDLARHQRRGSQRHS